MKDEDWLKYYNKFPGWIDEEAINSGWSIQRFWQRLKIEEIKKRVEGKNILDIGCGSGVLCRSITSSNRKVIGIDISKNAVRYSKSKNNGKYIIASASYLPFKKDIFDCIICSEVIEHLPQPDKSIKEASFCLKKNGKLIITTPNYGISLWKLYEFFWDNLGKGRDYRFQHISKFNYKKLKEIIEENYFGDISIKSFFILSPLLSFFNEKFAKRIFRIESKLMKNKGCILICDSKKIY